MDGSKDSRDGMMAAVQQFHDEHDLRNKGGEELTYRIALMAEELMLRGARMIDGRIRVSDFRNLD